MRKILVSLLVVAFLCAVAVPCLAAEAEPAGAHEAAPDLMHVEWPVAIATIVVFLLLLVVLTKFAWKPILAGLQAREEGIRAAIEGADKANADAKALLAEHQTKLAAAADDARAIVEEGRKDAETLRVRIEAEAVADAARERDRAVKDIEIAKDGALKDIYDRVAVIATEVAGKILQQNLDAAGHRRLVDEAVASYEKSRKAPGSRGGRA